MKFILIFILLTSICLGQFVGEQFKDFSGRGLDSLKGKWVFSQMYHDLVSGESDVTFDVSGKNHDLTIAGWANIAAVNTQLSGTGSPVYQGGDSLSCDGTGYFTISDADFRPIANSFSITAWIREEIAGDKIAAHPLIGKRAKNWT